MRLIDADALHKAYMELRNFKQDPESGDWISLRAVPLTTVIRMLNDTPTIEPKRGEWTESEYTGRIYGIYRCQYKCSCCEYVPMYRGEPIVPTTGTLLFCPNCGADMREREGE